MIIDGESTRITPMDDDRTESIIDIVLNKRNIIKEKFQFFPNETNSIDESTEFDVSELVEKFSLEDVRFFHVLEKSKVGAKLTRGEIQYLVKMMNNCHGFKHFMDGYTKGKQDVKAFNDIVHKMNNENKNIIDISGDI